MPRIVQNKSNSMIITHDIRLSRILKITWKTDLLLLLSCIAAFLANEYVISKYFVLPVIIPTILGSALAFFIGFNNNQAYSRWWEARQVWGSLVNNSRSWARGIMQYPSAEHNNRLVLEEMQQRMIRRHIGFLYALKNSLRSKPVEEYKRYMPETDSRRIAGHANKHNAILDLQSEDLELMYRKGWIDGFKFMHLNGLIVGFCDDMGKSERIRNTVFPTTYDYFTRLFIWTFGVLITIFASETTHIWSVALGVIMGFVFHTTHIIGMSLVNPFENAVMGTPLDQITRTIEINLLQMMGESEVPPPIQPVNNEYVM